MRLVTPQDIHFIDYKTRDSKGFEIYVSLFPIVFENHRASTELGVLEKLLEDVSAKVIELKTLQTCLIKKRKQLLKPKRVYVRRNTSK